MKNSENNNFILLLHNIRSIHNVGSLFRNAECFGLKEIYLSGFTPCPNDRFDRERKDFAKVSLGSEKNISWRYFKDANLAIEEFKNSVSNKNISEKKSEGYSDLENFEIIAIEQNKNSIDFRKFIPENNKKYLIILGNEVLGVENNLLEQADKILEIPQKGSKESLNVSDVLKSLPL